jgi:hypothetical protein
MKALSGRDERAAGGSKHRAGRDQTDTQITVASSAERAPRIEAEPAKREDQTTGDSHNNVVAGNDVGRSILVVFAKAGAEDDRSRECGPSADSVNNATAREVGVTSAKALSSQLG